MSESCRLLSLRLIGSSVIRIEAVLEDGQYHSSDHDLDSVLGNWRGQFDIRGVNFSQSARSIRLIGSTLHSQLNDFRGGWQADKVTLAPELPAISSGEARLRVLTYGATHAVAKRSQSISTQSNQAPSYGLGSDKHSIWTSGLRIDLDDCLGNQDGVFDPQGHRFSLSARSVALSGTILSAELANCAGRWIFSTIDVKGLVDDRVRLARSARPAVKDEPLPTDLGPSGRSDKSPSLIDQTSAPLYTPLDRTDDAIRLCYIKSGRWIDPIEIDMFICNDRSSQQYECLSYVWGDTSKPQNISVNGVTVEVTWNLHEALRRLRWHNNDLPIWIDALCINQTDLAEKTDQVAQMGHIYHGSDRVVIWLGEALFVPFASTNRNEMPGHELLLFAETFDHLAENRHVLDIPGMFIQRDDGVGVGPLWSRQGAGLGALAFAPWFERTWTVQELAIPKIAVAMFGSFVMPWEHLVRAQANLETHIRGCCSRLRSMSEVEQLVCKAWGTPVARADQLRRNFKRFIDNEYAKGYTEETHVNGQLVTLVFKKTTRHQWSQMIFLLNQTRDKKATNPRDKVYALLSLMPDQLGSILPDYEASTEKAYRDFTLHVIAKMQTLDIWDLANRNDDMSDAQPDLPSWVIDWRRTDCMDVCTRQRHCTATFDFNLATALSPSLTLIDERILVMQGAFLGEISSVTKDTWPYSDFGSIVNFAEILKEWASFATSSADDNSAETEGSPFWRTMMNDHIRKWPTVELRQDETSDHRRLEPTDFSAWQAWTTDVYNGTWSNEQRKEGEDPAYDSKCRIASAVYQSVCQRKLFSTVEGFLGIGPDNVRATDVVCVFKGGRWPFILRPESQPLSHHEGHKQYRLIGPAYVHFIMDADVEGLLADAQSIYLC